MRRTARAKAGQADRCGPAVARAARAETGQAAFLFLGVLAALLAGTLVLFGFGQALGTRGKHQRAADLAAVSAAQVMRGSYARLFEPPFVRAGVPNPRHLSTAAYLALARAAAHRGAVATARGPPGSM